MNGEITGLASGLSIGTLRKHAKSKFMERDMHRAPVFLHDKTCERRTSSKSCGRVCRDTGETIARDVSIIEAADKAKPEKKPPKINAKGRTIKYLRNQKISVADAEKYNSFIKRRADMFGFADLVALMPEPGEFGGFGMAGGGMLPRIVAIQCCSGGKAGVDARGSDVAEHRAKILAEPRAKEWLEAGGLIQIWSWRRTKDGRRYFLKHTVESIELSMFLAPEIVDV